MRQNQASKAAFDKAFNACLTGIDLDHPAAGEVIASDVMDALNRAGFEIVRKPQTAQQVQFSVRIGWPVFTSHTLLAPEGSDVATVTRAAKALANDREGGGDVRSRWVAFSWVESRFLAPDEPAPDRLVVGPYEDLVREVRPPEAPEMTGSDRERYERRWETGLRNIVTILHGPGHSFEIWTIVEEVRALAEGASRAPVSGSATEDRIEFARRLGNWDFVSLKDIQKWLAACRAGYMSRDDVIRQMGGDPVEVDRKIAEERARAASFGLSYPPAWSATETVALKPGATFELPPGTEIRTANTEAPEPEWKNLGLRWQAADDMAERYGCRVTLAGMDDADTPLTDEPEIGDTHYVVVTERATGRHVALVEAWETEDGDPLVPKNWLEVVLSAWDAARDPEPRAA
ncbi:hypothetical protein PUR29_10610 [Methylobacterium ajmalii]|uniref:Bacteriophage capsid protein n=2 Tax=Methylobacterium TaxID=407 RepID=A0A0C6FFV7_9HYPH|nr:hypothetical protein [Methylobacterium aquaticum]QRE77165.1 hypothetical protein F1D61_29755 [Methylobacterium aquaticum]BAQ45892.1 bacteriophage capsid protein [Methylobacterium aquaticum]